MTTFSVDTHLFRELGELLVGRDSTALVELIKNAYDADATEVFVYGESLENASRGFIRIRDNGIGMSKDEFTNGFLRIASRAKETSTRQSPVFKRRYTGAKGIGRLAAHKLAKFLKIESARWDESNVRPIDGLRAEARGLEATIDWDLIEAKDTLDQIDGTNAITIARTNFKSTASAGTTITLSRLRKPWTRLEHGRFLEELQTYSPPEALISQIPAKVVSEELLFQSPLIRDARDSRGRVFSVLLEGELTPPDDYWHAVLEAANWVIEIDSNKADGTVTYVIAPTEVTRKLLPAAQIRKFQIAHPSPTKGPFFNARILKRTGARHGELKRWSDRSSGIRVYMEGFRILPYGEPRNDWLHLDRDASERDRNTLERYSDKDLARQYKRGESDDFDLGLLHLPSKHYFGGVFLTERRAPTLKMLVNREGFIPDTEYETLLSLVRKGVDLSTRVQAAASQRNRSERRETRAAAKEETPPATSNLTPTASAINVAVKEAKAFTDDAKRLAASGRIDAANRQISLALDRVEAITEVPDELAQENAMVRVLASVGTQLASFVHEINGLLDIAASIDGALERIRTSSGLSPAHKRELAVLHKGVADLRRSLERQASYLVDVVAPDARRRRSRQILAKRFDAAVKLVSFAAEKRHLKIVNNLPSDLRSPPMFPAELTAAFSNLLTNAVKAAGEKGRIRITGKVEKHDEVVVRIENTGARVNIRNGERWFRPFESSTTDIDPSLGQGMGLGLPITRSMLEEYGATIKFVEPSNGFATAVEINFRA